MMPRTIYDNALDQITKLANQANSLQQQQDLIDQLNKIIIEYKISDKPIVYAPEQSNFASWNIACGKLWVDVRNNVGPSVTPLNNPTFTDNIEHDKRMECCLAVIGVLKNFGVSPVVLQEAPINEYDNIYTQGIIKGPAKPGGNISLAVAGDNFSLVTGKDPINVELYQLIKTINIQIKSGEVALFKDKQGNYLIDMHLNFTNDMAVTAQQQALLSGIHAICKKNKKVIAAGDSNMEAINVNTAANVYGARGCETTDIIMSSNILQNTYIPPLDYSKVQGLKQSPSPQSTSTSSFLNTSTTPIAVHMTQFQSPIYTPKSQSNPLSDVDEEFLQSVRTAIIDAASSNTIVVSSGGKSISVFEKIEYKVPDSVADIWTAMVKADVNQVKSLITGAALKKAVPLYRSKEVVTFYQQLNDLKNESYPQTTVGYKK